MITFEIMKFLIISIILFLIGILGIFLIKKNIIIILMSIELMLLAININFIVFSIYLNDLTGQIFSLFILTVAAAESAIGLAILVIYYRIKGIISINFINSIKG
jgi:NADH:ubiquinone oxidoreductase subunit K